MKYKLELNVNYFDKYGYKMFAYPILLSQLSFDHLKDTDQSFASCYKIDMRGYYFNEVKVFKKNWYTYNFWRQYLVFGRRGPYFRREYEIKSSDNLIVGASYSILFDFETNSIYRKKNFLLFHLMLKINI